MNRFRVVFVLGWTSSGKSTYAETLTTKYRVIEIGDIVRVLSKTSKRVYNVGDEDIFQYIKNLKINEDVVFASVRSKKLFDLLVNEYKDQDVSFEIMSTSIKECERRFYNAKRKKDEYVSFDDVIKQDKLFGLDKIIENVENNKQNKIKYI